MALANLRENKRARNSLSALHAARTCLFGARQLGNRKWYADKPGIAARLKTQTQRRQFRLGLVANLDFYNILNLHDLRSLLHSGDASGLAALAGTSQLTIPELRAIAVRASPFDILRVISPVKAAALTASLRQISAVAEYVQSLCGHMAANEALEPPHEVICKLLRTGADFERANTSNPIHLATAAVASLCHTPDVDGVLAKSTSQGSRQTRRRNTNTRATQRDHRLPLGFCFEFQRAGACTSRSSCSYRHECATCESTAHGSYSCTRPAT